MAQRPGIRSQRIGRVAIITGVHQPITIVLSVQSPSQAQLAMVRHALDALGLQFGLTQHRQQHRREDGDDRDYHQKFDESEASGGAERILPRLNVMLFHNNIVKTDLMNPLESLWSIVKVTNDEKTVNQISRHARHAAVPFSKPSAIEFLPSGMSFSLGPGGVILQPSHIQVAWGGNSSKSIKS